MSRHEQLSVGALTAETIVVGKVTSTQETPVLRKTVTATLAEVNAGKTIIPGEAGTTFRIHDINLVNSGTMAGATSIDVIEVSGGATTVASTIASMPIAGFGTSGSLFTTGLSSVTLGAGYMAPTTAGNPVKVKSIGNAATGSTSATMFTVSAEYTKG